MSEGRDQRSDVRDSFDEYFGKLARRTNLHATDSFAIQRTKMCLIASHERLAFICDGCGKYQAIVFRQRRLQRRQWQIWQLGCEMNLTEKMFEIRDSLWLLEKQIAMGFANDPFDSAQGRLNCSSAQHSCPAARAIVKSCRIEPEGLAAEKRMFASRKTRIRSA